MVTLFATHHVDIGNFMRIQKRLFLLLWVSLFLVSATGTPVYADVILCFGDSITAGGKGDTGYPIPLQGMVSGHAVVNAGVRGEVTNTGAARINGVMEAHKPKYALIMEGANDISQGYTRSTVAFNIGHMADVARQHGATPIVSTITPNTRVPALGTAVPAYNSEIINMAAGRKIILVDSYNRVVPNWRLLSTDGLHTNAAGARVIAEGFVAAIPPDSGGGGGGGGGCFIATAAFGSYMEPHVVVLRQFRDELLLPHQTGQWLVHQYYTYSPPVATFIASHAWVKNAVRVLLLPVVGMAYLAVHHFVLLASGAGVFLLLVSVRLLRRRRLSRPATC
jgi:lysophospholipase L1-like esterase